MDFKDIEKTKRLDETLKLNYRVTRLYATYLERFPEIITKDMIEALTSDGEINVKEALIAILSEFFEIDYDGSAEDRKIYRDYLCRSVKILDKEKYINNPYYKQIKILDIKDGDWEFKNEKYPAFRGVVCDDMIVDKDLFEVAPLGFFTEDFEFPAVLERGNEWMTLTPVDLDTCEEAISLARGKVVTFGLGLGYYAFMCSNKSEVESITVVEKSADVIRLFKKHILPQFPNKQKIKIVLADAFEYAEKIMPSENFDFAFVDTWRDASDGAPMLVRMRKLEHLSPNTLFRYWIERFLISHLRSQKYAEIFDKIDKGAPDAPKSYDELLKSLTDF